MTSSPSSSLFRKEQITNILPFDGVQPIKLSSLLTLFSRIWILSASKVSSFAKFWRPTKSKRKENCKVSIQKTNKRRSCSQLGRPFQAERLFYESLCSINLYHSLLHLQSRFPALLSNSFTLAIQFSTLFSSKSRSIKNSLTFCSWKGLAAIYSAVQSLTTGFWNSFRAMR